LVYFPIDVPRFVVAALMRVRPRAVAVMETELWLNFLWTAQNFGSRTILLNGRVSDRSFPRSMRLRPYYRALFGHLDRALVQTETDAERLRALGFKSPEVAGNTKFDAAAEAPDAKDWRAELKIPRDAFLVVVGSTRSEAEEALVVEALAQHPDAWVVHAPRHIERAPALAAKYGQAPLRSKGETGQRLVLDTYGELGGVYTAADVVIVGGGFDDLGGQNIIQPLALGKPVVHGPHMQNFKDVAEEAVRTGASLIARTADELAQAIASLKDDPAKRETMGKAAQALVARHTGAARRCAEAVVAAATSD
jgi:3-deoxy-D-manno-octulosonic-acid transferase